MKTKLMYTNIWQIILVFFGERPKKDIVMQIDDVNYYATIFNQYLQWNSTKDKPNQIRYDFVIKSRLSYGNIGIIHTHVAINAEFNNRNYFLDIKYFVNKVPVKCVDDGELIHIAESRIKNLFMQMDITHEEFSELVNENYQMN